MQFLDIPVWILAQNSLNWIKSALVFYWSDPWPLFFQAAEFLDIPDLFAILTQKSEDSANRKKMILGLEDLCLSDGVFSDILFKLEDGTCSAHKPILMARFVFFKST